jgi:hypothetical protein
MVHQRDKEEKSLRTGWRKEKQAGVSVQGFVSNDDEFIFNCKGDVKFLKRST